MKIIKNKIILKVLYEAGYKYYSNSNIIIEKIKHDYFICKNYNNEEINI
jgi:hypothetical protein